MRLPVQDQTMPPLSRALLAGFAGLFLVAPAAARITDPELSCADWLKTGAHRKSEHSATVAERIRAFCAANPKMKAIDAEMTMTGD
ncbi:hypothetical protein ARD30_04805 [Bosea thiooxidans]|uniref:Uncharacterized protein n=2 Tax=Bosea thiooxidans TaxID=53254 RepID=A0A0Q3SZ32_9HYPH|nr:hypothetical protein ARD30_04805 [Bosea thiooxidans]SKB81030.1 hypothetical protein SAMN05660750_02501 [Bosea thiooxidans]